MGSKVRVKTLLLLDDLGRDVPIGTSANSLLCPGCLGGDTKEKTLTITRTAWGILYQCHRASCKISGNRIFGPTILDDLREDANPRPEGKHPKTTGYTKPLEDITEPIKNAILMRWGIDEVMIKDYGLKWAPLEPNKGAGGRIFVPLYTQASAAWGCAMRSIDGAIPKVNTYVFTTAYPRMAWFQNKNSNDLIIVEDVLSALRASRYMNSLALLGTDFSLEKIMDVTRFHPVNTFLCLDRDATDKAIGYAIKYAPIIGMKVIPLEKEDIKDMNETTLVKLVDEMQDMAQFDSRTDATSVLEEQTKKEEMKAIDRTQDTQRII